MTNLIALLPAEGWARFICDALWQSTLIALMAWIVARWMVRQPAARAWFLSMMLTACVIVPLASAACRTTGWSVLTTSATTDLHSESFAMSSMETKLVSQSEIADGGPAPRTMPESTPANQTRWPQWTSLIGTAWLVVSLILTARLGLSMLALRRLKRGAATCTNPSLLTALAEATRRIGLHEPPPLLESDAILTPVVQCLKRPWLCVPAPSLIPSDNSDWTALFAHELAHIVRRDGWTRLCAELVTIALPLQPLVWLLRRELYRACEEACDDWAVASGSDPANFAAMLTAWLETGSAAGAATAMGVSSTKSRVLRLLTLREIPRATLSLGWCCAAAFSALLIVAGIAVVQSPAAGEPPGSDDTRQEVASTAQYVIEPPDILMIKALRLSPKEPTRVAPLEMVSIEVGGTLIDQPISGDFQVDSAGEVVLGPVYGAVKIKGMTRIEAQNAVRDHLKELLMNPRVALVLDETRLTKGIEGKHLVGPDGWISLGGYGSVSVGGKTIAEAEAAIEKQLTKSFEEPSVAIDVALYNSKVYYLIVKAPSDRQPPTAGKNVFRFPWTGNDTVMDAIAKISGLRVDQNTQIQLSRPPTAGSGKQEVVELKWDDILQGRDPAANPRLLPGDRLFISNSGFQPDAPAQTDKNQR